MRLVEFTIDEIPPSINDYYEHGRGHRLSDRAKLFRLLAAKGARDVKFSPKGIVVCLMGFYTMKWITQSGFVRNWDVDNRVKPCVDAVRIALNYGDHQNWTNIETKGLSQRDHTRIMLVEVGNLVLLERG